MHFQTTRSHFRTTILIFIDIIVLNRSNTFNNYVGIIYLKLFPFFVEKRWKLNKSICYLAKNIVSWAWLAKSRVIMVILGLRSGSGTVSVSPVELVHIVSFVTTLCTIYFCKLLILWESVDSRLQLQYKDERILKNLCFYCHFLSIE